MRRICFILCLMASGAFAADPANPPSQVTHGIPEGELPTLKITAQAEQRLGIEVAEVASQTVPESRLFGGEVMLSLAESKDSIAPMPPQSPEELRRLAEQQVTADGTVKTAQVQLSAARTVLERTTLLAKERAGSERALDDATTAVALAEANLGTAQNQRKLLGLPVDQALRSKLRMVRVTVSAMELALLDTAAAASASAIGSRTATVMTLTPATMPPSTNALGGTADIFYTMEEKEPPTVGQRVLVQIPVKGGTVKALTIPWSAVLYDANGGAWVYERTAPLTYVRRRVSLRRVMGANVLLDAGPVLAAKVVHVGAAELFGAEFGIGK
jgi:hypothetical protein